MTLNQVNCGTCHACCRSHVALHPEQGDDPARYQTEVRDGRLYLQRKTDGSCVYLGNEGCTIWPNHPAVCRTFDCKAHYLKHTRAQRRQMLAKGLYSQAIHDAGKERAQTQKHYQAAVIEVLRRIART